MIKNKLVEGYGFIGTESNTLYKFGNGKYKTFEGTEISIENCVKAKVKDLVVEGKTIQDTEDLSNIESVTERENNILSVKINDNTTTLNLPIPLRSLPNNVCDTIEGNKLVQRVGKAVLDGSIIPIANKTNIEGKYRWIMFKDNSIKNINPSSNVYLNCDRYNATSVLNTYLGKEGIAQRNIENTIVLYLEKYSDGSDISRNAIIEDLKINPATVYYILETPIIHSLEIPQLATTKGTNIITTSNNIKPKLSMKVKVKK